MISHLILILMFSHQFVSSFFCIPKKNGGFRPIVNLKNFNQFLVNSNFKMENLDTARNLLREKDWLAKIDLH